MPQADERRRLSAPFRLRNYRALIGSFRAYQHPIEGLLRYIRGSGTYPWTVKLRTPIGPLELLLPHPHDIRTVNEVFCRRDYGSGAPRVVVDVGANIGVSAAYFLTRRPDSIVHAWEANPGNLPTLARNLAPLAKRATIHENALAPAAGPATFLAEPVGRYSGLAEYVGAHAPEQEIVVDCEAIGDALAAVIEKDGYIDLLKIDTEGSEQALVDAVPRDLWQHIDTVAYELPGGVVTRRGDELLRS